MATHLTARLAWHMNGWNGRVCGDPSANAYCVGRFSYPGQIIAEQRSLEAELPMADQVVGSPYVPPCMFSVNAFGPEPFQAYSDPPSFFHGQAGRALWEMPPYSVACWPYEAMYEDDVKDAKGRFDNDRRREHVREFFSAIEDGKSLLFYYSNYSNPFSTEEAQRYVLVGVSRVKKVGGFLSYPNCSEEINRRYAQGMVWQRTITSNYPDEGFCIPFHHYMGSDQVLSRIVISPDNTRLCKYASRHVSDDEALSLIENLIDVAAYLADRGDTSERWPDRLSWLQKLLGNLWKSRGLYPGMPKVLAHIGLFSAIPLFRNEAEAGREQLAYDSIESLLGGGAAGRID